MKPFVDNRICSDTITIHKGDVLGHLVAQKDFTVNLSWDESTRNRDGEVCAKVEIPAFSLSDQHYFGYQHGPDQHYFGYQHGHVLTVISELLEEVFTSMNYGWDGLDKKAFKTHLARNKEKFLEFDTLTYGVKHKFSCDQTLQQLYDALKADKELEMNSRRAKCRNPFSTLDYIIGDWIEDAAYFCYCIDNNDGGAWHINDITNKIGKARADALLSAKVSWLLEPRKKDYLDDRIFFDEYPRKLKTYAKLAKHLESCGVPALSDAAWNRAEDKLIAEADEEEKREEKKSLKKRNSYAGKWWLVKWSGNWADEIDFSAQSVMTDAEVKAFKKKCKKSSDEACNMYYGTNQCDDDMTFGEYIAGCEFIEIKDKKTREFLLKHCNDECEWAPASVVNCDNEDY